MNSLAVEETDFFFIINYYVWLLHAFIFIGDLAIGRLYIKSYTNGKRPIPEYLCWRTRQNDKRYSNISNVDIRWYWFDRLRDNCTKFACTFLIMVDSIRMSVHFSSLLISLTLIFLLQGRTPSMKKTFLVSASSAIGTAFCDLWWSGRFGCRNLTESHHVDFKSILPK